MKKLLLGVFLGCLVCPLSGAEAQTEGVLELSASELAERGALKLSGMWRYHSGDDPRWALPEWDDTSWELVPSKLKRRDLPADGWGNIGWLRLHIRADSTLWGKPLGLICNQYGASEIYLDGRLLYRFGRIGTSAAEEETDRDLNPKSFSLPPGRDHLLAVRHGNFSAQALHRSTSPAGFSLTIGHLNQLVDFRVERVQQLDRYQNFFLGFLVAFSILHLLIFGFYPRLKRNFGFALFVSLFALLVFTNFQIEFTQDLVQHTWIERLWRMLIILIALMGVRVTYAFFKLPLSRYFWALAIGGALLGIASWFRLDWLSYVYIFSLVAVAEILRLIGMALTQRRLGIWLMRTRQRQWGWTVGLGTVGFIALIFYQILLNLDVLEPIAGFTYPYLIGAALFLVAVSAYQSYDFAQTHRNLETRFTQVRQLSGGLEKANRKLEGRVEARTRELTEANRELADAKEGAEQANLAKTRFLASMSHEIRTPMNAILGYAQILQRSADLPPSHRDSVETIQHSGNHLLNLINDILDLSKIEAGRMELHPVEFDLVQLVQRVESMFAVRCEEKGVQWRLDWESEPSLWVWGDEAKLMQVLINLLGNAVKFTGRGEVELKIRPQGRRGFRFEVTDTGPGISEDELGMLFDLFQQGKAGTEKGGTGLGLTLAQRQVKLMGGDLAIDSTVGKGTTFSFALPLAPIPRAPEQVRRAAPMRMRHADSGRAVRAFVADDAADNRAMLCHLLEDLGVEVAAAADGEQVMELLARRECDVLFLDLRMPVMDGWEVLRRVLAQPEWEAIKVVAVSASVLADQRQEALEAGFDEFIGKPLRLEQVCDCLSRLLGVEFIQAEMKEDEVETPMDWSETKLPTELVESLCEAVEFRQVTKMEAYFQELQQLGDEAGRLAAHLRQLRKRHDMDSILEILRGMRHAQ